MDEEWGVTPQERVLDHVYESCVQNQEGFVPDIYGVTDTPPEAVVYIRDPDGSCWEITARKHDHSQD